MCSGSGSGLGAGAGAVPPASFTISFKRPAAAPLLESELLAYDFFGIRRGRERKIERGR